MNLSKHEGRRGTCTAMVFVLALFAGCGEGKEYGPTGTVSGTVLFEGKPLAPNHAVVFMNLRSGYACKGDTDAAGNYQLDSWNNGELPIGKYSVTVRLPLPEIDPETIDPEELMNNPRLLAKMKQVGYSYPRKYSQIATSGLKFTVAEGENSYPIELKK